MKFTGVKIQRIQEEDSVQSLKKNSVGQIGVIEQKFFKPNDVQGNETKGLNVDQKILYCYAKMHYLLYKNIRVLEYANISKEFIEEIKNPLVSADIEYIFQDSKNCDKNKRKKWLRLCPEKNFSPRKRLYRLYV